MVTRIYLLTIWSNKTEIWQNLEKNATRIMISLPHYMWAENIYRGKTLMRASSRTVALAG